MIEQSLLRYYRTSPEIIRVVVMLYVRSSLSLRNVDDLRHERAIEVSHETGRFWPMRFGPMFAAEIRKKRVRVMRASRWRWHLDGVFVRLTASSTISGAPWTTKGSLGGVRVQDAG
jgi:putative transposase